MEHQMIKLLETIAANTGPKSSFYVLLNDKSTRIKTTFSPVLELNESKKYEMALVNLETYYSFPNIDASNGNFRYSPDNGTTWFDINIPEGSYEIGDINKYLQEMMKTSGHYDATADEYYISLEANNNTLKSVLNIKTNYRVDFTSARSVSTILGFNKQMYLTGCHESENIVNIMSVSSLRITSDIIGSSYSNGSTKNIIYSFFPNVGPGYKIIEAPINLIYLPITIGTISSMVTELIDQNGKLINLRGEELSIRFHIRQV
jgi:hypothetical protein